MESHKKFSDFLLKVVEDKQLAEIIQASKTGETGKSENEQSINWLRDRFINLKKENKKLKERKAEIARQMEEVRENEKQQMEEMTEKMYKRTREMQEIQNKIEELNDQNSRLDSEFENQVAQQNRSKQEAHQIVYSIENIYNIAQKLYEHRGQMQKFKKLDEEIPILKIEQGDPQALKKHVENIIVQLEQAQSTVHDLMVVKSFLAGNEKKRAQDLQKLRNAANEQPAVKAAPKEGGKKGAA